MSMVWPTVRLGEVLHHRKEFITIDDLTTYKRPRVRLHAQGIVLRDEVPGALIKTKAQQVCRTGELLVAEIDAKVGGFGIVPQSLDSSIVSSHYFLFVIDDRSLDRGFLDYFIRTPGFREQVAAQGSTNYAAIRPAHVLGYTIPLPPLPEQRRIVARIEELATKITDAKDLRHQAAEQADSLTARSAALVFSRGDLGPTRRCEEFCETITKGTTPKTYGYGFVEKGTPFLRAEEVGDGTVLWERTPCHLAATTDEFMSRSRIFTGDVLVTIAGTIGRCGVVPATAPPLNCNQAVALLRPIPREVLAPYLCWAVRSEPLQKQLRGRTVTTAVSNISLCTLRGLRVPVPLLNEQRRIVAKLDALQAEANTLKRLQAETGLPPIRWTG